LGNPGGKYKNSWHNLGFLTLDDFKLQTANFSDWKNFDRAQSLISEGKINNEKIILAKPQAFMNNSGRSVHVLAAYYKVPAADIVVIHDDADLPVGTIRVSENAGSAGHKGIESIIGHLKTKNFTRIRLGSRPKNYIPGSKTLEKFVLRKINEEALGDILEKSVKALEETVGK
ncbi:MAG: aminoacyl-tRNA hydrolase, partial [bacterium]|nr:aminoacyl-tRNA hydrolase [bacterium]